LDEKLETIEPLTQRIKRTGNGGQKLARICVPKRVVLGVGGPHRAIARQEPLPVDRKSRAER